MGKIRRIRDIIERRAVEKYRVSGSKGEFLRKHFGPILLLCLVMGFEAGVCANNEESAGFIGNGFEEHSARQLRIYKDALFHGVSEQIRADTAVALLVRGDAASKAVLLEALLSKENPPARQAVCRGLIQSVGLGDVISSRKEFMDPLVGMLIDEEGLDAKLAAEALLVFEYRKIRPKLTKLVRSSELDRSVRLNIVYALKLRPDPEAISDIIKLLDDDDEEIARAAETALQEAFGIPVGTDKQVWRQILKQLQRKSPSEIRKNRLMQQEIKVRQLQAERDIWRGMYLGALDKEYEGSDEVAKGVFLVNKLGSEHAAVKLWALDKVSHRSKGTVLPEDFGEKLMGLISDDDADVRLGTARVLSKMSELNPAEKLFEQFKTEESAGVRLGIFEALGEACYYAFSPGSNIKVTPEIKNDTLELAGEYINSETAAEAIKGAEVIRKLLELDGLEKVQAEKYLKLVVKRYDQTNEEEAGLSGDLLNVMARLCGQGSYYRDKAAKLFGRAFLDGLESAENDSVREAGVIGLINVDKVKAFREFKKRGLESDNSLNIRRHVIQLVGEMGKPDELEWLLGRIGLNGDGELAWEAVREILRRQDASVAVEWAEKISIDGIDGELGMELLEMAEKKAVGENNAAVLASARNGLVDVYLKTNQSEKVGRVLGDRLANEDIGVEDEMAVKIGVYLNSHETSPEAKTALAGVLSGIAVEDRPMWTKQAGSWQQLIEKQ